MRNVVIVDGVRTGFGKMGGALRQFSLSDLAAKAIDGLLDKTQLLERGGKVDGVYMGSALHDHATLAPARMSVLKSKLDYDVWTSYVERQCGSAIDSINHAAAAIMVGTADIMIAGGSESYSQLYSKFSMCVEPYKLIPPMPITQQLAPVPEDDCDILNDALAFMS